MNKALGNMASAHCHKPIVHAAHLGTTNRQRQHTCIHRIVTFRSCIPTSAFGRCLRAPGRMDTPSSADQQPSIANILPDGSFVLSPFAQCTAPMSTATIVVVFPGALLQPSDYNELAVALQVVDTLRYYNASTHCTQTIAMHRIRLWVAVQHISTESMFAGKFPNLQPLLAAASERGFIVQASPSGILGTICMPANATILNRALGQCHCCNAQREWPLCCNHPEAVWRPCAARDGTVNAAFCRAASVAAVGNVGQACGTRHRAA